MLAKIAISTAVYAIDKPYDYKLPETMTLQPGMRVSVPFGKGNRLVEGMVLSLAQGDAANLKTIHEQLDKGPVLSDRMLHLTAFLRERYFCTFYEALKAVLPAGLWFSIREVYELNALPENWQQTVKRKKNAASLIEAILALGGSCDYSALQKQFTDTQELTELIKYLFTKKLLSSQTSMLRKGSDKLEAMAELAVSPEEATEYARHRRKTAPQQAAVLELLAALGCGCVKELLYFTGAAMPTVRRLEKLGYITLYTQEVLRRTRIEPAEVDTAFALNAEQAAVYDGLKMQLQLDNPGVALLYGVTGSGKTAVYIQLIRACLAQGKMAMLLVPEIALTPQLLSIFAACFGEEVAVLHSSLRVGERYDEWKRIKNGKAHVVLGTRSAVFAPTDSLGLIILDEEQEHTYKSENAPRYHAREVAIYRGVKEKALVLLGSATPSVETMYRAKQGSYTLYTLKNRYNGARLPAVELVDMKQQLRDGNNSVVSSVLLDGIRENIRNDQKTILLLNRRGGSPLTVCIDCGYIPECPRCSVSLVFHMANNRLMCHHCGFSGEYKSVCPECGGHMKQVGSGTQRVQCELEQALPEIEILRMDADTISAAHSHEYMLSRFAKEKVPVLLGTQMVAKGLNFPSVTLVGVLDADMSLYVQNYRASETTFSLITQVVGRAGRSDKPGRAVVQTMTPKNAVITLAAQQDYDGFYDMEIELRRLRECPPFLDLLQICFVGFPERQVLQCATAFKDALAATLDMSAITSYRLLGPAPAPITKVNNRFHYGLMLCCENSRVLRQQLAQLLRQFSKDAKNKGVYAYVDINSMN